MYIANGLLRQAFLLTYSTLRSTCPFSRKVTITNGTQNNKPDIFIKASVGFLSPPTKTLDDYTHIVAEPSWRGHRIS